MGTVTSSTTNANATAYGSQRKVDRCQNGVLWTVRNDTTGAYAGVTAYSADGGNTWTAGSNIANGSGSATQNYNTDCSLFIDLDDYAHLAFKDNSNGYLYYTRGTPNAARTAYTWSAPVVVENSSTIYDLPDLVVVRNPAASGAWIGYIVATAAGNNTIGKCVGYALTISSSGAVTVSARTNINANLASANSNLGYPSIDFRHNGDGKTAAQVSGAAQPDLFIIWSNGTTGAGYGIRSIKGTYSNGAWTMGTEREIDNTNYYNGASYAGVCMFDGTRAVIAGSVYDGTNINMRIYERDAADTTTTTRQVANAVAPSAQLYSGTASYDGQGNVYFFGVETNSPAGSRNVAYQVWTRGTAALGARVTISTTGNANPYMSARRGNAGQAIDYVYTNGTASPYTVTSGRIILNQPPNAPTVTAPTNGATLDTANPLTLTITPSDPDGDAATAWDVRYRPTGTTAAYVLTSGPFSPTVPNNTSTTIQVLPANVWGGRLDMQVRTYDTSNTAGAWSTTLAVTGLPQALASQTGGQGGTAVPAMNLYAVTQAERALRAAGLV